MFGLVRKEFSLVAHPSSWMLAALGALVLIPSWPYVVILIWGLLPAFFNGMVAREYRDYEFSFTLPVSRADIATSKVVTNALLQLSMCAVVLVCVCIKGLWWHKSNALGVGANFAYLGVMLLVFGVFNLLFYPMYLKNPRKVGIPFLVSVAIAMLVGCVFEVLSFQNGVGAVLSAAPFTRVPDQLVFLFCGIGFFALATFGSVLLSRRSFSAYDL